MENLLDQICQAGQPIIARFLKSLTNNRVLPGQRDWQPPPPLPKNLPKSYQSQYNYCA